MKRLIVTYFIFGAIIFSACGGMDKTLENTGFTLKGPFISEKEIFFLNPATNSIIKINSESGKVNSFRINAKIYTIIEQLLPSLFIISANDESGEIKLIEYDESGKEKRSVNIGSPFTSFELSEDKEYLIMRHTSKSNEISGKRAAVFFKNEVGILEIKTGILRKTTLNFSIMDRPLIFSDPQGHLMSFLCQEGVIIMDYKNPDKIKYVYLDIDRKSPEIESALFSQTGRYMFLKVKNKDDIYSLSVDNNNEDMLVKVNVPSSPYKGLTYISPVTINNSEDTFIAQYSSPTPKLVMMSAESNTTYQNQIPLDSGSNILDTFEQGKILYTIIVNYWLKYIKITSVYPIAENIKAETRVFADDFITLGYSPSRDIVLLQYDSKGISIKYLRPQITEKSIKMISKEFSFLPHNNLLRYNNRFNIFFFISLNRTDSSGNNFYQLNYINFNNGNTDWTDIDYLPAEIYNINDLSFVLSKNSENDTFSLVNFNRDDKVITYTGLKYNGLSEF